MIWVDITDVVVLERIKDEALEAFLIKRGYRKTQGLKNMCWVLPTEDRAPVPMPTPELGRLRAHEVHQIIEYFAMMESRSQLEILAEMGGPVYQEVKCCQN